MHNPHPRIPFFSIFYSTTTTALSLVLAALLLVTPGDHIYESFNKRQIYHIFIVAGLYLLTSLTAIFIYAGRLYAARSALAGIPTEANWAEEPGRVGREIRKGLAQSSRVSYETHPRDLRDEKAARGVEMKKKARPGRPAEGRQSVVDTATSFEPAWGVIAHPGWSSPCSPDLPNVHYEPVILELSHLIEAKAVSLAPSDPLSSSLEPGLNLDLEEEEAEAPIPDPVAVELLQRPASMGLRDYLSHLATLGIIDPEPLASEFIARYEHARYSGEKLDEGQFRAVMGVFAEILRGMRPLEVGIVDEVRAEMLEEDMGSSSASERGDGDAASVITTETVQRTPQPETYSASSSSSSSSFSTGSRSGSQGTIHTAPSRPAAVRNRSSRSRRSVRNRSVHQPSLNSLRRVRTDTSSSGYSARSGAGSVIRLKEARGPLDLPYAIITGDGDEV